MAKVIPDKIFCKQIPRAYLARYNSWLGKGTDKKIPIPDFPQIYIFLSSGEILKRKPHMLPQNKLCSIENGSGKPEIYVYFSSKLIFPTGVPEILDPQFCYSHRHNGIGLAG